MHSQLVSMSSMHFGPYKRFGLVAKNIEENGHTPKHPLGMFLFKIIKI